ncbi:phosphatase PAP2 family protein [Paenibacillus sp.]|uniref:phosphatase PAP2 family protein n=1 Tax=Paenibacillus sp. TaxID=58172 RepID=UPI002D4DB838|nr:phosphatase PAP2 family protein [Paenibacillus sp.]HZG85335.1 phosphatase PAP2 family protein [Paenibacillus sp.]
MNTPVTRVRLRRKPTLPAALAAAGLSALLSLALGFALRSPAAAAFDEALGAAVRGWRSGALDAVATAFDAIGSTVGFAALTLVFAGALFALRRSRDALLLIAATVVAWVLNTAVKNWFDRPRPEADALFAADGFSYPSGNATIAMALFGFAAAAFASRARSPGGKTAVRLVAALAILLLGVSRVYAGVHYPTDIVGGYLLGFAVAVGLSAARRET